MLRSGLVARNHPFTARYVRRLDLNSRLMNGSSVLVEVPQGHGLSLNGKFYPHCTSRDCTVMQAASDAAIHPSFVGPVMLVLRTFPIRVGNLMEIPPEGKSWDASMEWGKSGDCYPDQKELTWDELGVEPEITTVTKRVRRVFTFSQQQLIEAMSASRPTHIFLSHVDYLRDPTMYGWPFERYIYKIKHTAQALHLPRPAIYWSDGPSTDDVHEWNWK